MSNHVDLEGLIGDGLLDLDEVFARALWHEDTHIGTFTACVYGENGDKASQVEVDIVLQTATEYGITAYRWTERDGAGSYESGPVTLERAEAIEDGKEWAEEHNEEPDTSEDS